MKWEGDLPAYARMLIEIYNIPLEEMTAVWDVIKGMDMRLVANLAKVSGGRVTGSLGRDYSNVSVNKDAFHYALALSFPVLKSEWAFELFYWNMLNGVTDRLTPEEVAHS